MPNKIDKPFRKRYLKYRNAYKNHLHEKMCEEIYRTEVKRKRNFRLRTLALFCLIGTGIWWWTSKETNAPVSNRTPTIQDTALNKSIITQSGVTTVGSGEEQGKENSKIQSNSDNKNNATDTAKTNATGSLKL